MDERVRSAHLDCSPQPVRHGFLNRIMQYRVKAGWLFIGLECVFSGTFKFHHVCSDIT